MIGTSKEQADRVRDQRIERVVELVAPATLLAELPLGERRERAVVAGREQVVATLKGADDRLLLIVGPCSVHDTAAALDYARRLSAEARRLGEDLLIVMRVYFEKPRTTHRLEGPDQRPPPRRLRATSTRACGWRGALLLDVLDLGLPVGCEFLDPITPQYISDTVAWGAIGARTTESQIHRQLGSGLSMPIGFKNRTDGNVQVAVDAVRAAAVRHAFAGIDDRGAPAILHTSGNPDGHVILRGGRDAPNYTSEGVAEALAMLRAAELPERVVIDASHDNSGKDPERQAEAAGEIADQIADGAVAIVGVMLESFLVGGRQDLGGGAELTYGQSITDACMDWEQTHAVLERLAAAVRARRCAMRIAVLGVGLIGGSIGLAARRRLGAEVIGFDREAATLQRAVELGAIERGAASLAEACGGAELVFCAAPVAALPELAAAALTASPAEAAVTDVGSTKRAIVAALGEEERFIGGHPLGGAEGAGIENARAELFEGARWYLTPTERSAGLLYERLARVLLGLGARPQAIEAAAHDRLMATVSHLPHVLANALVAEAAAELSRDSERLPDVGPSFRDATRVAGANPAIWGDIFAANGEAVAAAAEALAARLGEAAELMRGGDREALAAWHAAAAQERRRLADVEVARGPLCELRVVIENRPGTVAELALALGEAGVNIEDMALHPAPDMRSGAVSLWVAGEESSARAAALVRELGHAVTLPGSGS